MLVAIWNPVSAGELHTDPGDDFYTRLNLSGATQRDGVAQR